MKTSKFSETQICSIFKETEASMKATEICRTHIISQEQMKPPSERVSRVSDQVVEEHGYLKKLCSDNGPKFIAQALADRAGDNRVELAPIKPGKPTQNHTSSA